MLVSHAENTNPSTSVAHLRKRQRCDSGGLNSIQKPGTRAEAPDRKEDFSFPKAPTAFQGGSALHPPSVQKFGTPSKSSPDGLPPLTPRVKCSPCGEKYHIKTLAEHRNAWHRARSWMHAQSGLTDTPHDKKAPQAFAKFDEANGNPTNRALWFLTNHSATSSTTPADFDTLSRMCFGLPARLSRIPTHGLFAHQNHFSLSRSNTLAQKLTPPFFSSTKPDTTLREHAIVEWHKDCIEAFEKLYCVHTIFWKSTDECINAWMEIRKAILDQENLSSVQLNRLPEVASFAKSLRKDRSLLKSDIKHCERAINFCSENIVNLCIQNSSQSSITALSDAILNLLLRRTSELAPPCSQVFYESTKAKLAIIVEHVISIAMSPQVKIAQMKDTQTEDAQVEIAQTNNLTRKKASETDGLNLLRAWTHKSQSAPLGKGSRQVSKSRKHLTQRIASLIHGSSFHVEFEFFNPTGTAASIQLEKQPEILLLKQCFEEQLSHLELLMTKKLQSTLMRIEATLQTLQTHFRAVPPHNTELKDAPSAQDILLSSIIDDPETLSASERKSATERPKECQRESDKKRMWDFEKGKSRIGPNLDDTFRTRLREQINDKDIDESTKQELMHSLITLVRPR